jgi:hypothetical protein
MSQHQGERGHRMVNMFVLLFCMIVVAVDPNKYTFAGWSHSWLGYKFILSFFFFHFICAPDHAVHTNPHTLVMVFGRRRCCGVVCADHPTTLSWCGIMSGSGDPHESKSRRP